MIIRIEKENMTACYLLDCYFLKEKKHIYTFLLKINNAIQCTHSIYLIREFSSHTKRRSDFKVQCPNRAKQRVKCTYIQHLQQIHFQYPSLLYIHSLYVMQSQEITLGIRFAMLQLYYKPQIKRYSSSSQICQYQTINISCYILQDDQNDKRYVLNFFSGIIAVTSTHFSKKQWQQYWH